MTLLSRGWPPVFGLNEALFETRVRLFNMPQSMYLPLSPLCLRCRGLVSGPALGRAYIRAISSLYLVSGVQSLAS